MKVPTLPVVTDPQLIDIALTEIQAALTDSLSWLDHAFGKAKKITKTVDNKASSKPYVYAGLKDYLPVLPDETLGCFSYFEIEDGEEIKAASIRASADFVANFGLVVWFDFRKVYPTDWERRTNEHVKKEVLDALRTTLRGSSLTLLKFYERAENIYKGYDHKEINNQFLMRPFSGFRLDGTIKYFETQRC